MDERAEGMENSEWPPREEQMIKVKWPKNTYADLVHLERKRLDRNRSGVPKILC